MSDPCRLPEWHTGECAPVSDEDFARALQEPTGSDWERRRAAYIAEISGDDPEMQPLVEGQLDMLARWASEDDPS